jgi:hypothetical protein
MERIAKILFIISAIYTVLIMASDSLRAVLNWGDFDNYSSFSHTWLIIGGLFAVMISLVLMIFSLPDNRRLKRLKKIYQAPFIWR